ncbi:GFA family protein [Snodgrassella sp. CFCC 13594]|uniref:GFA family protein n=1 Tax=Snodgrassella sp. CFCC 13594 TaxID=1775559 RepID=UPI000A93418A|nr:GFA family protein [Snodgrassella sp. CFCC 13594]
MMMPTRLEGGCLCGRLRYCIQGALIDAGFCHCRMCQKSSGAPMMAWATFFANDVVYTQALQPFTTAVLQHNANFVNIVVAL